MHIRQLGKISVAAYAVRVASARTVRELNIADHDNMQLDDARWQCLWVSEFPTERVEKKYL